MRCTSNSIFLNKFPYKYFWLISILNYFNPGKFETPHGANELIRKGT